MPVSRSDNADPGSDKGSVAQIGSTSSNSCGVTAFLVLIPLSSLVNFNIASQRQLINSAPWEAPIESFLAGGVAMTALTPQRAIMALTMEVI
jgi:hypothetical protein